MFNRLLSILKKENSQIMKQRNGEAKGPISLNIGLRRRTVAEINQSNSVVSKKLDTIKSSVPSGDTLRKHEAKIRDLHVLASTSRFGHRKDDPLVSAQRNFNVATSRAMSKQIAMSLKESPSFGGTFEKRRNTETGTFEENTRRSTEMNARFETLNQVMTTRQNARNKLPFNPDNIQKYCVASKLGLLSQSPSPGGQQRSSGIQQQSSDLPKKTPIQEVIDKLMHSTHYSNRGGAYSLNHKSGASID